MTESMYTITKAKDDLKRCENHRQFTKIMLKYKSSTIIDCFHIYPDIAYSFFERNINWMIDHNTIEVLKYNKSLGHFVISFHSDMSRSFTIDSHYLSESNQELVFQEFFR